MTALNPTAITRAPGTSLARCELTYLERRSIDIDRALDQHRRYREILRSLGVTVVSLPAADSLPDACFVEDTALVLDEVAILANPGAESRRGEIDAIASALAPYRRSERVESPATFDGGDVLRIGRTIYVGLASRLARTNDAGVEAIRRIAAPLGYDVRAVPFHGCLHLQSAVTQVGPSTVILNPDWIDAAAFMPFTVVRVADGEPHGANTLRVGETVLMPMSAPSTAARLRLLDYHVECLDISEFEKAEAGVTCLSILL
jgi:dimethylargininase